MNTPIQNIAQIAQSVEHSYQLKDAYFQILQELPPLLNIASFEELKAMQNVPLEYLEDEIRESKETREYVLESLTFDQIKGVLIEYIDQNSWNLKHYLSELRSIIADYENE